MIAYGTALVDDPGRIGDVGALGLDDTLFRRKGRWRTQQWTTSIVDVTPGAAAQLLGLLPGKGAAGASAWLDARPQDWLAAIRYGSSTSCPYRKTFEDSLGHATLVANPFHLEAGQHQARRYRHRVQNKLVGHRGRKHDPLKRARGCSPRPANALTHKVSRHCSASLPPVTPTA